MRAPGNKDNALRAAESEARKARNFRDALEVTLREVRIWKGRHVTRAYWKRQEEGRRGGSLPERIFYLSSLVDQAHDMVILTRERIRTCSRAIKESEMLARIYWERSEGRSRDGGPCGKEQD